jgi:hypothetical protein
VLSPLLPNGVRLLAPQSEPELSRWKAALERDRGLMRERANRRALQAALLRCGLACEEGQLARVCVREQQLSTERAERVVGWAAAARLRRGSLPAAPAPAPEAEAAAEASAATGAAAAAAVAEEDARAERASDAPQQQAVVPHQGAQPQQPQPAAAAQQADLSLLDISAADLEAGGRGGRCPARWGCWTCAQLARRRPTCSLQRPMPWRRAARHYHPAALTPHATPPLPP